MLLPRYEKYPEIVVYNQIEFRPLMISESMKSIY